jgi:kynurenine formamidase
MASLVDLSHPLKPGQPCFPGDPELSLVAYHTVASIGCHVTQLSLSSHQGTHLDVPFHVFDDGKTVDQMPLARFFGPAVLVDLAPGGCLDAKTSITLEMLLPHAAKFQPGAKVLYRTGWDRRYGQPGFFSDSPSLTVEAARWIAERRIGLLGMDTGTPSTESLESHWILLGQEAEIVLVECLANLDRLPERFTFFGFPLNLEGRDGSPIRAVALVE